MQRELFPECFQDFDVVHATDIHPCHGLIDGRMQFVRIGDSALVAVSACIIEQVHLDRRGLQFTDVNQRAGRQSRLLRPFLDEFHSSLLVRRFRYEVKRGRMWLAFLPSPALLV